MAEVTQFQVIRRLMAQELEKDPELFHAYQANVAVLLMDRYNRVNFQEHEWRNQAAKDILNLIFGIKDPPQTVRYYTQDSELEKED